MMFNRHLFLSVQIISFQYNRTDVYLILHMHVKSYKQVLNHRYLRVFCLTCIFQSTNCGERKCHRKTPVTNKNERMRRFENKVYILHRYYYYLPFNKNQSRHWV